MSVAARARLGMVALLALAACQAAPRPEPPGLPTSYSPAARERMLRIARDELAEWEAWQREAAARPGQEAVCGGRAEAPESRVANFHRVLAYWNATGIPQAVIERNRARFAARAAGACLPVWDDEPWSAAFVSFVMANAGVARFDWPPSLGHRQYLDHVIRQGDRFGAAAPFLAREAADTTPQPGDIICADRSADRAARLTRLAQRRAEMDGPRAMHCDIVLGVQDGAVEAVGGNLSGAVARVRRGTDPAGRLLPEDGGLTWFAVIENRMGRLPPFVP